MVKCIEVFECPYCQSQYEEYSRACDCARSCADYDLPTESRNYICEVCNESYTFESDAVSCESDHEKNNDDAWKKHVIKHKYDDLHKAAMHPGQKKIIDVVVRLCMLKMN